MNTTTLATRRRWLSVVVAGLASAFLVPSAAAETVLILKNEFIQKYKNRATIEVYYLIDKAHKKLNPASKDADIHVAGRAPKEVGLATVAEMMNAKEREDALEVIRNAEGSGQTVKVKGSWRVWPEHGGEAAHNQGAPLAAFDTTNPDHVFEIHPITEIGGIDVRNTFHPIEGYEPKEAEQAFGIYERTRSRITPLSGNRVKIETPMAGMNYVKFELELREKALPVDDGRMAMGKARNTDLNFFIQLPCASHHLGLDACGKVRKDWQMLEVARPAKLRTKSMHILAMAKRRTKRRRKVPMLKPDDMQKTTNEIVDATTRSFEGATKATQGITAEIADFEHGAQTMEKLLRAKSADKAFEVQTEYAKVAYEGYVSYATRLGQLYADLGKEAFRSYQDFASRLTPVR